MKIVLRCFLATVAFIFIPFLWLGFNFAGVSITIVEFYAAWLSHLKSKEPWGPFDQ